MSGSDSDDVNPSKSTHVISEEEEDCCESKNVIEVEDGSLVCTNCGLVHGVKMVAQFKLAYSPEEVNERITHETLLPYNPIPRITLNSNGKHRPSDWSDWIRRSRVNSQREDRCKYLYYKKLVHLGNMLNLPQHVVKTANKIFQESLKRRILRGRAVEDMQKACFYYSAKINKFPLFFDRFFEEDIDRTERKKVYRCMTAIKGLVDELYGDELRSNRNTNHRSKVERLTPLLMSMGNRAGIPMSFQLKAVDLYEDLLVKGYKIDGKSKVILIGGLLFTACKVEKLVVPFDDGTKRIITQRWIADKSGVTEISIRNRIQEFAKLTEKNIKKGIVPHPIMEKYIVMKHGVKRIGELVEKLKKNAPSSGKEIDLIKKFERILDHYNTPPI